MRAQLFRHWGAEMGTRTGRIAAIVAVVVVAIAACGPSSKPTPPIAAVTTTSAAMATSTTPDPDARARADALTAYKGMIAATTREFGTNQQDPDLPSYSTGNAYVFFTTVLTAQINQNIIYTGAPQSSPVISNVDLGATPPTITVTDCFGGPAYLPVFASGPKKGQSEVMPGTSTAPHRTTVQLTKRTDRWKVENYTIDDQTC